MVPILNFNGLPADRDIRLAHTVRHIGMCLEDGYSERVKGYIECVQENDSVAFAMLMRVYGVHIRNIMASEPAIK